MSLSTLFSPKQQLELAALLRRIVEHSSTALRQASASLHDAVETGMMEPMHDSVFAMFVISSDSCRSGKLPLGGIRSSRGKS